MGRDLTNNEAFVLGIIGDIGPCTGYEIIREGDERGKKLGVPSLYEAMDPLYNAGLISGEERLTSSGEQRWHWRITEEGEGVLAEQPEKDSSAPTEFTPQPAT